MAEKMVTIAIMLSLQPVAPDSSARLSDLVDALSMNLFVGKASHRRNVFVQFKIVSPNNNKAIIHHTSQHSAFWFLFRALAL